MKQRNDRYENPSDVLERKIRKSGKERNRYTLIRDLAVTLLVVYFLFGVIFGISIIEGNSMEPNIRSGDIAIFFRPFFNYKTGDVVIMHNTTTNDYVKRVAAVAGDELSIDDNSGSLIVNDKKVDDPNVYSKTYTKKKGVEFPMTVGADSVFLLGDNREVSKDSREFGVVKKEQIAGKVLFFIRRKANL